LSTTDVLDDPFVLVFPPSFRGAADPIAAAEGLPFVRYSLDTGMGQRIESQLTRMRLRLPNVIEVDIVPQQLTMRSRSASAGASPRCSVWPRCPR